MQRFQAYMDDTLDTAALQAEQAVADAKAGLPTLTYLMAEGFSEQVEQIRARDSALADNLSAFQLALVARSADDHASGIHYPSCRTRGADRRL
ncbi:hypothetical protein OO012_06585 [Rhodobacteraceae bacterium KMM 6894]|nr:hypothetical protein [Rhodobacteraceae bacterium KMM 6894]